MTNMKMAVKFEVDDWFWHGWNCMKLRVWGQLQVQLKAIGKIGIKMKYVRSQIKNPDF